MAIARWARIGDIPPDRAKVASLGEDELALCNGDGRIYFANLCTYGKRPLGGGWLVDGRIRWQRHGARFGAGTGAVRRLTALTPLPTFEVRPEGDDVLVVVPWRQGKGG